MHRQRERVGTSLCRPVVALCLITLGLWGSSQAAEFACGAGDVACLIAAVNTANTNGEANTITLAAGLYTLTAVDNSTDGPTGLPSIASVLTLRGAGAQSTGIERAAGAPQFRLLHVAPNGTLALYGLTLRGGDLASLPDGGGGGIRNRGMLTMTHSLLHDHAASSGGGIDHIGSSLTITNSTLSANVADNGGGILCSGNVTIIDSTLSGNVASEHGGGIYHIGSSLTITNSTLSDNTAGGDGGGILLAIFTLTLTNSTVSGNTASRGGGISIGGAGAMTPPGHAILRNTILAQNTVPATGTGADCFTSDGFSSPGQATSQGHNLLGDPTGCRITLATSDLTGDPGLDAFIDDATPGRGHFPLLPGSRALETGDDATCPSTDQLGQPRVGHCDIGAIEFQPGPDTDVVTIHQVLFVDRLALLFITATSTAVPAATLFVTVPGCWEHAAMALIGGRYVHLHAEPACGDLNGRTVVVSSSHGGAASTLLR